MERRNILVCEDDPSSRTLIAYLLRRAAHHVVTAATGKEALDALAADTFDVVILDLLMPVADGFDVLEEIRQRHERTCVIVLTAAGPVLIGDRDLSRANFIVPKPFDIAELVELAATCTNQQPAPPPPPRAETAA